MMEVDENELFDRILMEAGGFGKYQVALLFMSLLASTFAACNHLSPIYLTYTPKFHCIKGDGIKVSDPNIPEECLYFNQSCVEWKYDQDVFTSTVVTQFDLVCHQAALLPTIASSYMSGIVVTILVMGLFSDRFGRRTIIICLSSLHIIASFVTAFASNYTMFVMVRFFVGGSIHAVWSAYFILMAELVPSSSARSFCGGVLNFGWNIGSLFMTSMAYFFRDWHHLQLAFAIGSLSLVSYFFFIPESPRWLVSKNRIQEAQELLWLLAKKNGVDAKRTRLAEYFDTLKCLKESQETNSHNGSSTMVLAKNAITNSEYLKRTFLLIPPFFAVGVASYGIHFAVQAVDFDIFATAAIKECVILAIILILMPIYKKMKRTICVLIFYILGGLVAILFIVPDLVTSQENAATPKLVIFLLAQGLIVGNFFLVDTYAPDVFSTDVRNFTFCFLDSVSKIGTTFAPFIIYWGNQYMTGLPPAIFGAMIITSSVTLLFTPETKGYPLVQTLSSMKDNKGYPSIFQRLRLRLSTSESLV